MIQSDYFNLAFVSENSILTILRAIEASKAAGLYSPFGLFLKNGAKFLAKHNINLCNLSITSV